MPRENGPVLPSTWVMVLGSLAIGVHLFLALVTTLSFESGPWPVPSGDIPVDTATAPYFAVRANQLALPYQRALKVTHSFHFLTTKQEQLDLSLEAIVRDADGKVKKRLTYPETEAPAQIRYRQNLLVHQLASDIPLPPQQGIIIAPKGEQLPTVRWWHPDGETRFVLKQDNVNAVPRNQQLNQPSNAQFLLVNAYSRFLARSNDTAKVEIVRSWQQPLQPFVLMNQAVDVAAMLRKFQSSYGELPQ